MLLGSRIDQNALNDLPYPPEFYVSWQEMEQKLAVLLAPYQTIGLDYSPGCALPVASRVDAGTFEFIKRLEKTIKSAANVFQAAAAVWSEAALAAHLEDCRRVAAIKDDAFDFIAAQLRSDTPVTEYDVQQFIMQRFADEGLITPYPPIVGVNANSGDPALLALGHQTYGHQAGRLDFDRFVSQTPRLRVHFRRYHLGGLCRFPALGPASGHFRDCPRRP